MVANVALRKKIATTAYSTIRPRMLKYLKQLNRLQWLSVDEQVFLQQRHLAQLLSYANTYVPFYRDLFKDVGFHPSDFIADPACFHELPLLTKEIVQVQHDRLITTEPRRRGHLVKGQTGGTTGEPMKFMQDRRFLDWRRACTFHVMGAASWEPGSPQGWLWGDILVRSTSWLATIMRKLENWVVFKFNSNAFHLTDPSMTEFAAALERFPETVIWSYPSIAYSFARFVETKARNMVLGAVFTTAEPLYEYQREYIEEVLDCPVFNCYGTLEVGHIACECDRHRGLHTLMRNCYVEVLRDGEVVPDGHEGEFVVTNLTNLAFPFIRYRLEDWGMKSASPCTCGRGLPLLQVVQGRVIDFFKTRDRGRVWAAFLAPMMASLGDIKQFQIVQESVDLIVFRLIMERGKIQHSKFQQIQQACRIAMGNTVEARIEYVDALPSTPRGKHRFLVSTV